jgi:peptide-methionine (S)-S-oxide reductase
MRRSFLMLIGALLLSAAAAFAVLMPGGGTAGAQPGARAGEAVAVFAGGCFWCTEKDLAALPGVRDAVSGYTGGHVPNPTYAAVSAGGTGHLEAVQVRYDPARIGYAALVRRFLRTVDPLDGGGQFCDRGAHYRSAIFVRDAAERRIAEAEIAAAARQLGRPVATEILPAATFYPAEAYHQDYAARNPVRYRFYRWNCGRDQRLAEIWGPEAGR